jgi:sugar phosphate permease
MEWPKEGYIFRYGWEIQVWLLFGSRAVQTILRMALGPLLVFICEDQECSATDKGKLLSAFSLGYFSTQILGGALGDAIGARSVIAWSHILAGLCLAGTGKAMEKNGLQGLWFVTLLLGVTQGPLFPASMSYLSNWLLAKHRSWASTMLDSGITVGSLIVMPLTSWLSSAFGWKMVLLVYGALSVVFAQSWQKASSDDPRLCIFVSKIELEEFEKENLFSKFDDNKAAAGKGVAGIAKACASLLQYPSVWALYVGHAAFNFGVYFQNSWSALYYKEVLKISPKDASLDFILPHIMNLIVKAFVVKRIFVLLHEKHGLGLLACRRFFTIAGFLGAAVAFTVLIAVQIMNCGRIATTLCYTVAMAFVGLHPSGFKANYMDLSVRSSGLISGLGNTLASVASFVGPLVVGYLLEKTGSWPLVFGIVACINVAAALVFGSLSSITPVDIVQGESNQDKKKSK